MCYWKKININTGKDKVSSRFVFNICTKYYFIQQYYDKK